MTEGEFNKVVEDRIEQVLYDCYMAGFLTKQEDRKKLEALVLKAIRLGEEHYRIGDDVSSIDNLSKEEILAIIKN